MMLCYPSPTDLAQVAEINNYYLGKATMQLSPVREANFMVYLPGSADSRHGMFVGLELDEVIGFALVKPYSLREGYVLAGETSVYIHPDQTGRGYGLTLMHSTIDLARSLGYRHLTAKIWTENEGSIRFHEQLGYQVVGIQHGIGWVGNRRIDTTIMERLI